MIRRERRDGREPRGNEEGRRERIEKRSHCFFKSSGYDKLELKYKNLECIIKKYIYICHGVKQYAKICAIGEHNVIN